MCSKPDYSHKYSPTNTHHRDRQNKKAKPSKPFGLAQHRSPPTISQLPGEQSSDEICQLLSSTLRQSQTCARSSDHSRSSHSRTPSLSAAASKPPSHGPKPLTHQYAIADIAEMPVNDYGGFHDEDETVEREFALKHKWTTSNSKVYTSTSAVEGIVLTFCSALLVSPVRMKNLTRNLSSRTVQLATQMQICPRKSPNGSRMSSPPLYRHIVAPFQTRGSSHFATSSQNFGKLCFLKSHTTNKHMVQEHPSFT